MTISPSRQPHDFFSLPSHQRKTFSRQRNFSFFTPPFFCPNIAKLIAFDIFNAKYSSLCHFCDSVMILKISELVRAVLLSSKLYIMVILTEIVFGFGFPFTSMFLTMGVARKSQNSEVGLHYTTHYPTSPQPYSPSTPYLGWPGPGNEYLSIFWVDFDI